MEPVVLFDLDGVLVDSQGAEVQALVRFAADFGIYMSDQDAQGQFAGERLRDSLERIRGMMTTPRAFPSDAESRLRLLADRLIGCSLRPVQDVARVLSCLDLPRYVVSNSPLAMIEDRLAMTGLAQYFDGPHFSAYEMGAWKPDPAPYTNALTYLGLSSKRALAVEDSAIGVTSAALAGVTVAWYTHAPHEIKGVTAPEYVFQRMSQLLPMVEHWRKGTSFMPGDT